MMAAAIGMKRKRQIGNVVFHVAVGGIAILMMYPIVWMLFSSFKETNLVMTTVTELFPREWTLDNYVTGWKGFGGITFATFFKNSFVITILSTAGAVLSSTMVAYGFARVNFKGKNVLFFCMIITMMLPNQVIMIPQYIIFNMLGWVNTMLPIVVPAWMAKAFFIFMIMQFMEGIPRDLDEAARIDGCSEFMILLRIIIPLAKGALATLITFTFTFVWNDYLGPMIYLHKDSIRTIQIGLRVFQTTNGVEYNLILAGTVMGLLPLLIVYFTCQKYFTQSVTATGLKG